MKAREFDPLHLDVAAFAEQGASQTGHWPLAALARLASSEPADAPPAPADAVRWSARGERRPARGGEPETWLHLEVSARLHLECQRCLRPVETLLQVEQSLRFVAGEAQAAALDADSEHDVLALERSLDLRELIEDELLLVLPLVPRHDTCPEPLQHRADRLPDDDDGAAEVERPNPFAVLQQLKTPGTKH